MTQPYTDGLRPVSTCPQGHRSHGIPLSPMSPNAEVTPAHQAGRYRPYSSGEGTRRQPPPRHSVCSTHVHDPLHSARQGVLHISACTRCSTPLQLPLRTASSSMGKISRSNHVMVEMSIGTTSVSQRSPGPEILTANTLRFGRPPALPANPSRRTPASPGQRRGSAPLSLVRNHSTPGSLVISHVMDTPASQTSNPTASD